MKLTNNTYLEYCYQPSQHGLLTFSFYKTEDVIPTFFRFENWPRISIKYTWRHLLCISKQSFDKTLPIAHVAMHCHTKLTKCAVMCGDGCRVRFTRGDTETRGPHRQSDRFNVPVTVTQICSVTNAVTVGWAWPLTTTLCDFTRPALREQELHRWRLLQPTLSAFVSQLLSRTIGSGKLTRPCTVHGLYILTIQFSVSTHCTS